MKIFVGLGNPGGKYAQNRHNIGFMALDSIAQAHGFSPWRAKFNGQISDGQLGGQKILLLKPQTYMNKSGDSVAAAASFYKVAGSDITVFHDELDLAPSKCRHKIGGGHAGHNGLRSIHAHMGADYARVRMGIGHPGHKDAVASFVLHDFAKGDQAWLQDVLDGIADGAPALAAGDAGRFMNAVALRVTPPRARKEKGQGEKSAKKAEAQPEEKPRSPLQKLLDRFG